MAPVVVSLGTHAILVACDVGPAEMVEATLGRTGAQKKEWVLQRVSELSHVDRATLDDFVEAAVAELKAAREELQQVTVQVLAKFPR